MSRNEGEDATIDFTARAAALRAKRAASELETARARVERWLNEAPPQGKTRALVSVDLAPLGGKPHTMILLLEDIAEALPEAARLASEQATAAWLAGEHPPPTG